MNETLNLILAATWVLIQAAIVYYFRTPYRVTHQALGLLAEEDHGAYAYRVGLDRLRAHRWRFAAIAGMVVIGLAVALPLPALRLAIGPLLFFGELVLLRNARADALLVRDLAAHLPANGVSSPSGTSPAAPRAPGREPAVSGDE